MSRRRYGSSAGSRRARGMGRGGARSKVERLESRTLLAASLAGFAFHDLNGDGARSGGEPGLAGWTVFLDADSDGQLDAGETSAVTASDGSYFFGSLAPGTHRLAM